MKEQASAEIKCLGEDFDPNFHNAVMTEDSTEYESGKVTEVLQKGYTLNGTCGKTGDGQSSRLA